MYDKCPKEFIFKDLKSSYRETTSKQNKMFSCKKVILFSRVKVQSELMRENIRVGSRFYSVFPMSFCEFIREEQ